MDVIPVIDLKAGQAVHAVRGERERYRAVTLSDGCVDRPSDLAGWYQDRLGTRSLYVADLDAIAGQEPQWQQINELGNFAEELWVDIGINSTARLAALVDSTTGMRLHPIIGLESLRDLKLLQELSAAIEDPKQLAFSLDLRAGEPLARPTWSIQPAIEIVRAVLELGLQDFILLDLADVGSRRGPGNLALIPKIRQIDKTCRVLHGGGVRDFRDLEALREAGVSATLLATALHQGAIGKQEVLAIQEGPPLDC